jgi:hypothetical protein
MLCTHEFEEIVLTEDEELVGMRFRHFSPPLAASAFHYTVFGSIATQQYPELFSYSSACYTLAAGGSYRFPL